MTVVRRHVLVFALLIVVSVGAIGPRALFAQRSAPVKIGALTESWGPTTSIVALRDTLHELGYRENTDFVIGVRFTQGNPAELPAAARDLVRNGADILVTDGSGDAAKAAQMAAPAHLPIVFMGGSDPVARGLVRSFARPGGNITGIADLDIELAPKRLELFREIVPGLKRVMLPYDVTDSAVNEMLAVHREAARQLGLTLVEKPLRSLDEARAAVAEVRKGEVDGILSPQWLSLNIPGFMLDASTRRGVPTMFRNTYFVENGGLAAYSVDGPELGRKAARLVDKILKGARPADLPVEQAAKFHLLINLKMARTLGITIPPSVLLRADRVLQ